MFTALSDEESKSLGLADNVFLYSKTPKGKRIRGDVNKALKQLENDGTLTRISEQYLDGGDYAPKS